MDRLFFAVVGIALMGLLISCSATETTTESDTQTVDESPYPSWYQEQAVVENDSTLMAYATAIDSDSASSVSKAVAWAETELSSYVAATLEDIRAELSESGGGDTGVNNRGFIFALAKNDAAKQLASTTNTEVETVEGFESHRSYAEVSVDKKAFIESLDEQLAGYEKAWNSMKESQAFEEFSM